MTSPRLTKRAFHDCSRLVPKISDDRSAELMIWISVGKFVHINCIDIPALSGDHCDENNLTTKVGNCMAFLQVEWRLVNYSFLVL